MSIFVDVSFSIHPLFIDIGDFVLIFPQTKSLTLNYVKGNIIFCYKKNAICALQANVFHISRLDTNNTMFLISLF